MLTAQSRKHWKYLPVCWYLLQQYFSAFCLYSDRSCCYRHEINRIAVKRKCIYGWVSKIKSISPCFDSKGIVAIEVRLSTSISHSGWLSKFIQAVNMKSWYWLLLWILEIGKLELESTYLKLTHEKDSVMRALHLKLAVQKKTWVSREG